jgi:hypothetical protein
MMNGKAVFEFPEEKYLYGKNKLQMVNFIRR